MHSQAPQVPLRMFQHYKMLCLQVRDAPTEEVWRERVAFARGFLKALRYSGYDERHLTKMAQEIWVEKKKAEAGIPLSFDDPPTAQEGVLLLSEPPADDGEDEEEPEIHVHLTVAQHEYEDDWDWFDGEPGVCGAPFCRKPGDHPIHLKPRPHEWENHPEAPGICRVCGHPEDREWHTTSPEEAADPQPS